jgi:hypothetical protein
VPNRLAEVRLIVVDEEDPLAAVHAVRGAGGWVSEWVSEWMDGNGAYDQNSSAGINKTRG